MRAASLLFLTSVHLLAGCGADSSVDGGADAGVDPTDGATSPVCPDEWSVEVVADGWPSDGSSLAVTGDDVAFFDSTTPSFDGGARNPAITAGVDRCGRRASIFGADVATYHLDERGFVRGVSFNGIDKAYWNGIPLPPSSGFQNVLIEFRDDASVAKIDLFDYTKLSSDAIHYAWGGRVDVTVESVGTSFAPTVSFHPSTDAGAWSIAGPGGARDGLPRATAVGGGRAVVASWEASSEQNPSTLLVDAFSRDASHLWRTRVPTTDWFPKAAVLNDGSTLLLRLAPPPTDPLSAADGLVLSKLSPSGEVSRWTMIGAQNALSSVRSMSVGRDGRAVIAIAALNSRINLCGQRYPGSTNEAGTRAYLVGIDEVGHCAFVRPFEGVRANTRISDTYVTSDQHVIILWGDQYTEPSAIDPRAHQIIERVRWETLVARWGTSSNAPDAGL